MEIPNEIRITNRHTRQQVAKEQRRCGDATPTKTAERLITERLAQLEQVRDSGRFTKSEPVPA